MHRNNDIRIDETLQQRVREYARTLGVSEEVVFTEALQEYLANRQGGTLLDAFQEDGLIGCLPGTPPDLSTNEAHFEGFGLG